MYGIVTLYDSAFQPNYPQCAAGSVPLDYNSDDAERQNDFQVELLPLHSQLLGESLLVSFPPLINMLKSSGSSYLISGPMLRLGGAARFLAGRPVAGLGHCRARSWDPGPTPPARHRNGCTLGGCLRGFRHTHHTRQQPAVHSHRRALARGQVNARVKPPTRELHIRVTQLRHLRARRDFRPPGDTHPEGPFSKPPARRGGV